MHYTMLITVEITQQLQPSIQTYVSLLFVLIMEAIST